MQCRVQAGSGKGPTAMEPFAGEREKRNLKRGRERGRGEREREREGERENHTPSMNSSGRLRLVASVADSTELSFSATMKASS